MKAKNPKTTNRPAKTLANILNPSINQVESTNHI